MALKTPLLGMVWFNRIREGGVLLVDGLVEAHVFFG